MMSPLLIATVGVIYFCISINSFINGQMGLGISFLGYAIGSVGLYFQALWNPIPVLLILMIV